jgi:hypothetical protein
MGLVVLGGGIASDMTELSSKNDGILLANFHIRSSGCFFHGLILSRAGTVKISALILFWTISPGRLKQI